MPGCEKMMDDYKLLDWQNIWGIGKVDEKRLKV